MADLVVLKDANFHGSEVIRTPIGNIDLTGSYFNDDASKRQSSLGRIDDEPLASP